MAGYFKKLNGHVYDGQYKSGVDGLENGVFVELTTAGTDLVVTPVAAAKNLVMRVHEKTIMWQRPAVILDVVKEGTDEVYFVENEWENYEVAENYDTSKYTVDKGHPVKMRRPLLGEQVIMTVDDALYATLTVGQMVSPAANGTIA